MSIFRDATERRRAVALARLAHVNPFLPDRVIAEKEALGGDYVASAPVWSSGEDLDNPNVERVGLIATELSDRWRRRLERHNGDDEELTLYRDVATLGLYERTHPSLYDELIAGGPTQKVSYWTAFEKDHERTLVAPGVAQGSAAHLFACFYQVRRAYEAVFHTLSGGSGPAAELRAAAWRSIFGANSERYRRFLYRSLPSVPTLITGPTGTGKELVARAIGESGYIPFLPDRKRFAAAPTVKAINLSAVPTGLVESELFGHRQGAFTGAVADRIGFLDACPVGGAVFLDEIGDLQGLLQVKLLRVLEERRFVPVGDSEARPFHGKIIAATHVDLPVAIDDGRFRQDLFYRLCGDQIRVPSLQHRLEADPGELRQIARNLLSRLVPEDANAEVLDEVCAAIQRDLGPRWAWPGNVRELSQCIRRVLIHGHCRVEESHASADDLDALAAAGVSMTEMQRRYAQAVYGITGSYAKAGERLGVDWRTVRTLLTD